MASTQIRLKSAFCHNWALLHYGGVGIPLVYGALPPLSLGFSVLSLRPGWLPQGVSSMDTIGKKQEKHQAQARVATVPTGKSRTGIAEGPGTLPPE